MGKRYVLAIEHDWRMRKLIQANLEAFGLEVRGAVDGRHSLSLIRENEPDLILIDTDLPDMEVTHLLDCLQAQLSAPVPIIILSPEPPSRHLKQNGYARRYLIKPFAVLSLLQQVRQALDDNFNEERRVAQDG